MSRVSSSMLVWFEALYLFQDISKQADWTNRAHKCKAENEVTLSSYRSFFMPWSRILGWTRWEEGWKRIGAGFLCKIFCIPPVKINNRISVWRLTVLSHYLELLLELPHFLLLIFLGNAASLRDYHDLTNSLECWQKPREENLVLTYAWNHCHHLNQRIKMKNKNTASIF